MNAFPLFEVKFETRTETHTRLVIDKNYIGALRTGISKMPDDIEGPLRISCTKLCNLDATYIPERATA